MFVSVIIESGGIDSAKALLNILQLSGFKKIRRACWENMNITEDQLSDLKKDIDRVTDYYDKIRIYQYPVNGMFVITELKQKKWRKAQFTYSQDKR
ncbi:MAG: CRISPR-associated protein Cas2 [Treponema sp.]|nr:CRISPR-associated protein Cas2 [Treponema sp.]